MMIIIVEWREVRRGEREREGERKPRANTHRNLVGPVVIWVVACGLLDVEEGERRQRGREREDQQDFYVY